MKWSHTQHYEATILYILHVLHPIGMEWGRAYAFTEWNGPHIILHPCREWNLYVLLHQHAHLRVFLERLCSLLLEGPDYTMQLLGVLLFSGSKLLDKLNS